MANATYFDQVDSYLANKANEASQWVDYGANLANSTFGSMPQESANVVTDIHNLLAEAASIIAGLPSVTAAETISYLLPTVPTLHEDSDIGYTTPTFDTTIDLPSIEYFQAGTAPDATVVFNNDVFDDALITDVRTALSVGGTGLGDAEEALFNRETARQNTARFKAYEEITTQFSARGFEMPPGALLAKQTELNNESNIRLADSSSQIMAESAKLTQAWNQTTLTAATQTIDILGRLFDSRIMRDFEAAKQKVLASVEIFKTGVQVIVANAGLQGQYFSAVSAFNDAVAKKYSAEVSSETTRVNSLLEIDKNKVGKYSAEIQSNTSAMNASTNTEEQKRKVDGIILQKASTVVQLDLESVRASLTALIEKYKGDIEIFRGTSQAACQIIASALGSINTTASLGAQGTESYSESMGLSINYDSPSDPRILTP